MSEYDPHEEEAAQVRTPPGMGLAGRFTIGLGLMATAVALVAGFILWKGANKLSNQMASKSRAEMARKTGEILASGPREGTIQGRNLSAPEGVTIQTGQVNVATEKGPIEALVYQISVAAEDPTAEGQRRLLYAPVRGTADAGQELLVLIVMVCGGLVVATVIFGAVSARRVAAPLMDMVEDVAAISRGRLDRHIHAEGEAKEITFLARAVDRMVRDLVKGQQNRRDLEQRQLEAESLRELRRNLKPLSSEGPAGWDVDTLQLEAGGPGTGDFVDSIGGAEGGNTLVVGSTASRGMPGALLMAMTRAYLRGAIQQGASAAEACGRTNASLNRDLARGLYASAMVLQLQGSDGKAEMVSAGHKAPAVRWDAAAGQLRKIQPNGIALGFDEGAIFTGSLEVVHLDLVPGDALLLFSPGLFELENAAGRGLGEAGVYTLAKIALEQGLGVMEQKLTAFLGGPPEGDLAFALLRHRSA